VLGEHGMLHWWAVRLDGDWAVGAGMWWRRLSAMPWSLGLSLGSGESWGRVWGHAVPCAGVCVITDTHGAYTSRPLPLYPHPPPHLTRSERDVAVGVPLPAVPCAGETAAHTVAG
jgi:hypothetical protein